MSTSPFTLSRPHGQIPPGHRRLSPFPEFLFGSAYYPEHWDGATRARDPERMRAAGWNCVRLAEFAWDLMVPCPGRYGFALFSETIATMAAQGIRTILCNPTATPPRWMTVSHPEILRVDPSGIPLPPGSRQHVSHIHPLSREPSRQTTGAMAEHAFAFDVCRGWTGNFFVVEHPSGPRGQGNYFHDTPEPGEMRRLVYGSIAHGADRVLSFRWRTCRFDAEEYWCGILDHDDVPRRRYAAARQLGSELSPVGAAALGTEVVVEVGIATSDVHGLSVHAALSLGLPPPAEIAAVVHATLFNAGYAPGWVHPYEDSSRQKLFVVPHWSLSDPAWVPNLAQFVERAGTLVIGARTATKDLNNNVVSAPLSGCRADLCEISIKEYGRLNCPDERPLSISIEGEGVPVTLWYELLQLQTGLITENEVATPLELPPHGVAVIRASRPTVISSKNSCPM